MGTCIQYSLLVQYFIFFQLAKHHRAYNSQTPTLSLTWNIKCSNVTTMYIQIPSTTNQIGNYACTLKMIITSPNIPFYKIIIIIFNKEMIHKQSNQGRKYHTMAHGRQDTDLVSFSMAWRRGCQMCTIGFFIFPFFIMEKLAF